MTNKPNKKGSLIPARFAFIDLFLKKESNFIIFIGFCILLAGTFYPYPHIAMWIGFGLAAYATIANDSIQTIGTFIASNAHKKWWILWLYIGVLFVGTALVSWYIYDGDVTYQRLTDKGFKDAPTSFHFLQIAAPIFLIIITRLKVPVSTTFLMLSAFSTSATSVQSVFQKSVLGYAIAFTTAITVWTVMYQLLKKASKSYNKQFWETFQWITTGFLWVLWIVQDAANIAVFLPRSLSVYQLLVFVLSIFFGLGIIFYLRGDKIQQIVEEKTDTADVRKATIIDLVYVFIMAFFSWINTIPMSTTWVFIGLLGGRELAIQFHKNKKLKSAWKLILKDLMSAIFGLVVSLIIAILSNEILRTQLVEMLEKFQPK